MALANLFAAGAGWELGATNDPMRAIQISAAAAQGEEIVNELILRLARAIRNEIAEAWNKGNSSAST